MKVIRFKVGVYLLSIFKEHVMENIVEVWLKGNNIFNMIHFSLAVRRKFTNSE
jgi:hypothetical protein